MINLSISSVTGDFFDIFGVVWSWISSNPMFSLALFAPIVLLSISMIIKAFR